MIENFYKKGNRYDAQHTHLVADVEFYRSIARDHGGPILELACGTGRITGSLVNDGHDVVGLDIEESMLSVARAKLPSSTKLVLGDMRRFEFHRKFRLIVLGFNSIGHLYERSDVERCLECVKKHLAPDGMLVLSAFNPNLCLLLREENDFEEISRYIDPDTGQEVVVTEAASYDRASQVITSRWRYSNDETDESTVLRLRIFFPQELDALLHYAGFTIRWKFGNFNRSEFSSGSPQQIILAGVSNSPSEAHGTTAA